MNAPDLPVNRDAEMSLLGAMLLDPACHEAVAKLVSAEDFHTKADRLIYSAILRLGTSADGVSLKGELLRARTLDEAGGAGYIASLISAVPNAANAGGYAKDVRELADRRRLIAQAGRLDHAARTGTLADIASAAAGIRTPDESDTATRGPTTYTADELDRLDLPEPRYVIPGLLPEGLALLAGAPKLGKSYWVLNVLVALAAGGVALGRFLLAAGDCLYLALEDGKRRMKKRIRRMLGDPEASCPKRLTIAHEWPRSDSGGLEALDRWLAEHPGAFVVIDTAAKFLPVPRSGGSKYDLDYAMLDPLQRLAMRHGVTILVVTHKRKAEAADLLETVTGSNGVTGCADTTLILRRERGRADAYLFATGRDVDEQDLAMRVKWPEGVWSILGDAEEYRLGQTNDLILKAIREAGRPLTPKETAEALGEEGMTARGRIKRAMARLAQAGRLRAFPDGRYGLPGWSEPDGNDLVVSPAVPVSPMSPASTAAGRPPEAPGTRGTRETVGTERTIETGGSLFLTPKGTGGIDPDSEDG